MINMRRDILDQFLSSFSKKISISLRAVRQEDGDTGERLYRRGYRPREDTDSEATLGKWRHLEVMSWCDWDAPEE